MSSSNNYPPFRFFHYSDNYQSVEDFIVEDIPFHEMEESKFLSGVPTNYRHKMEPAGSY